MTVGTVRSRGQADDSRARSERPSCTDDRILKDCAVGDRNSDFPRGVEVDVWLGLAATDMLAATVEMIAEVRRKTEVIG